MKEEGNGAVLAFQYAVKYVQGHYGFSLRQMCLKANVSEDAAQRAASGKIKRRVNANVLRGLKKHYPEFEAAFSAAMQK